MVAVETAEPAIAIERRFVLYDVPWWTYVALRDALDDQSGVKMTYLEGALELISPSTLHEEAKKIIARLVEVWAMERDVDLRGFGGRRSGARRRRAVSSRTSATSSVRSTKTAYRTSRSR